MPQEELLKPREYGEPISMDAPGFDPGIHRDLVVELNDALTRIGRGGELIGPANADSRIYSYRLNQNAIEFFDRDLNVWRLLSTIQDQYQPAYAKEITVTVPTSGAITSRTIVEISAAKARPDGADIRVWAKDVYGRYTVQVPYILPYINVDTFKIIFPVKANYATQVTYLVTYGDPTAVRPAFNPDELREIFSASNMTRVGAFEVVTNNPGSAYVPVATFESDGSQIFGNRDDSAANLGTPLGAGLSFGSGIYTVLGHNPNGGLEFGTLTSDRPSNTPNSIGWANSDIYETWRREVILSDGFAWHILTGNSGYTSNLKLTIRYYNYGRWTVTMFHNTSAASSSIRLNSNGSPIVVNATIQPKQDDPSSWIIIDAFPSGLPAVVGDEQEMTGTIQHFGGLRPLYASSVLDDTGKNLQETINDVKYAMDHASSYVPDKLIKTGLNPGAVVPGEISRAAGYNVQLRNAFAPGYYIAIKPVIRLTITGLKLKHTEDNVWYGAVWDEASGTKIAATNVSDGQGPESQALFANQVVLEAGSWYRIGYVSMSGTTFSGPNDSNLSFDNALFTVRTGVEYYPGVPSIENYPNNALSGGYSPSFSVLYQKTDPKVVVADLPTGYEVLPAVTTTNGLIVSVLDTNQNVSASAKIKIGELWKFVKGAS